MSMKLSRKFVIGFVINLPKYFAFWSRGPKTTYNVYILYSKMGNIYTSYLFRGTQRICSSHYLFPRGILLAGKNTGVSMSWLGNLLLIEVLPGNY